MLYHVLNDSDNSVTVIKHLAERRWSAFAKVLTNAAKYMAKKAAGQMSMFGTYQPKEPTALKKESK